MTDASVAITAPPSGLLTTDLPDVSANLKQIIATEDVNSGIGKFEILLRNPAGTYNGSFHAQYTVDINISSADIIDGWVDSIHKEVSDDPDVFTQDLRIFGRSYGRELADLTVDKYYVYQPADDIVDDLLSTASSNITYTTGSAISSMSFDSKNAYLIDSIKSIAERNNYDFYVGSDKALNFFAIGSNSSGIALASVSTSGTANNILDFEWDEEEGTDIKNYIICRGKKVEDGWTEFNASDITVPTSGTASDETTIVNNGVASIKYVKGAASASWVALDFSGTLYGRTTLNWSGLKSGEITFGLYATTGNSVFIELRDSSNNTLYYNFGNMIPYFGTSKWVSYSVAIGSMAQISTLTDQNVTKIWLPTSGTLDWSIINRIRIGVVGGADFYLDALNIPAYMLATSQDATSQSTYGVRQLVVDRMNLESQLELQADATAILAKRKDVIKTLTVVAKGSAGISGSTNNWKPGYTVTINIPDEGITNQTYRMLSIQHIYDKTNPYKGHEYIVKLTLVPSSTKIDAGRIKALKDPSSTLKELRNMLSVLQQQEEGDIDRYPALPASLGELYVFSSQQWVEFWEADKVPITLESGTSTVSDANATQNIAIKRLSSASSADMWDSADIWPPGGADGTGGTYYFHCRMKVTSNASSATIVQLAIYNVTGATNLETLNISPDMFTTSDTYEIISIRASLNPGYPIKIRGDSFVTGITDVYFDWVGVSSFPIPYSTTGMIMGSTSDSDNPHKSSDADDAATNSDADNPHTNSDADNPSPAKDTDTATGGGNHTHGYTTTAAYLPTSTLVARYCASSSGGNTTASFLAIRAGGTTFATCMTGLTGVGTHSHAMSNPTHDHGITSPSHDHGITSPTHDHGITSPSHDHGISSPSHDHGITSPLHTHTPSEGAGHVH